MRTHHRTIVVVVVLAVCSLGTMLDGAPTESAPPIPALYDVLATALRRVTAVEYEAELIMTNHVAVGNTTQGTKKWHLKFAMQGNRFYTKMEENSPISRSRGWEGAFNGKQYQRLRQGLLDVTSHPKSVSNYHAFEAITHPFGFAFDEGDRIDYFSLLNQNLWTRLAAKSRYLREEQVANRVCDVVLIRQRKQRSDFTYTVYLAREMDYYPIKWDCDVIVLEGPDDAPDKEMHTKATIDAVVHDVRSEKVIIPLRVRIDIFDPQERLVRTTELRVDPSTLRINEPVPDEVFHIDPAVAQKGVFDRDMNTRHAPPPSGLATSTSRTSNTYIFLGLLLLMVMVGGFVLRKRILRRRIGE